MMYLEKTQIPPKSHLNGDVSDEPKKLRQVTGGGRVLCHVRCATLLAGAAGA